MLSLFILYVNRFLKSLKIEFCVPDCVHAKGVWPFDFAAGNVLQNTADIFELLFSAHVLIQLYSINSYAHVMPVML